MVWDYYANNPKAERVFRYYMALTRSITVHSLGHVVRAFDWGQVKTVVDVKPYFTVLALPNQPR